MIPTTAGEPIRFRFALAGISHRGTGNSEPMKARAERTLEARENRNTLGPDSRGRERISAPWLRDQPRPSPSSADRIDHGESIPELDDLFVVSA